MPEFEVPPPSADMGYYRAQVDDRAARLARRRRARRVGSTTGALALVVVVAAAVVATQGAGPGPADRQSASPTVPAAAPGGRPDNGASGASAGSVNAPAASGDAPGAASGAVSVPPEFSVGRPAATVTVDRRPSGGVVTVDVGQTVLVVLASTGSGWGRAIVRTGATPRSVLAVVAQTATGTTERIVLRAGVPGKAALTVPRRTSDGRTSPAWRATVVVREPAGFRCPTGTGPCRRPLGSTTSGG